MTTSAIAFSRLTLWALVVVVGVTASWHAAAETGNQPGGGLSPRTKTMPRMPAGPPTRVVKVSAGAGFTCAVLDNGSIRCWGKGDLPLGYGNAETIGDNEPASAAGDLPLGGLAVDVSAGTQHACAVLVDRHVKCWGNNDYGQLGYGRPSGGPSPPIGSENTPADVPPIRRLIASVSAGSNHSCAIVGNGRLLWWGMNGLLISGADDDKPVLKAEVQRDIKVPGGPIRQVACGNHNCLLLQSGDVRCWGSYNMYGELGPNEQWDPDRTKNVPLGAKAKQVSCGGYHTCALLRNGHVRCWGSSRGAGLGREEGFPFGPVEYYPKEIGDVPVGELVTEIATGDSHTCALLTTGAVRCWGMNYVGQLGYGHTKRVGDTGRTPSLSQPRPRPKGAPPAEPLDISLSTPAKAGDVPLGGRAVQISAGYDHTCAVLDTGKVRCWGGNEYGQLGYGHTRNIGDDETPESAGDVPVF